MTLVVALALAPAGLWVWYFYRSDKRPEPLGLIVAVFVAGGLMVYPAYHLELWMLPHLPSLSADEPFTRLLLTTILTAGLVEETCKFLVVFAVFLFHHEFDEPVDGVIYAVTAAMGFTAAEDFIKHISHLEPSRAFSPPGHAMFAGLWGYELGQMLRRHASWASVFGGLLAAILAHGMWDAIAFYNFKDGQPLWVAGIVFCFAAFLFWFLEFRLHAAQAADEIDGDSDHAKSTKRV